MTIPSSRSLIFELKSTGSELAFILRTSSEDFGLLRNTLELFGNLRKWSCRLQKSQHSQDKNLTPISQKKLAGIWYQHPWTSLCDIKTYFRCDMTSWNSCTYVDKQRQVQMLIYMRWRLDNYWETRRGDIRTPSRNSPSLQNRKRLDSQKWMTWKILANCLNTVRPTQFQTWTIKAKKVHVNNSPLNYLFSVKGNLLVTASSLPK